MTCKLLQVLAWMILSAVHLKAGMLSNELKDLAVDIAHVRLE